MNKNIFSYFIILILFFLSAKLSPAQEKTPVSIRNPFIPQLPVEKIIETQTAESATPKTPGVQNPEIPVIAEPTKNILEERQKEQLKRDRDLQEERQREAQRKIEEENKARLAQEEQNRRELMQREEKAPSLTITGVVWNTERPQAIIDGKVLSIGDTLRDSQNEEIKINKIYKTGIDVSYKGKTWTIVP